MSQAVIFGGYEPEPEGIRSLSEPNFREMDKGLALRTHLFHMLFYSEVVSPHPLAEVPEHIGRLLVGYNYRPSINGLQQN